MKSGQYSRGYSAFPLRRRRNHAVRPALGLGLGPVLADADVDGEGRVERIRAAHLLSDEVAYLARLGLGHLEQQLVVHLEDEAGRTALSAEAPVDGHHRHLDDVGVRSLHYEVDRDPLAETARLPVRGPKL